jgi:acyl carrier protein
MTDQEIRTLVSEALVYAAVPGYAGGDAQQAFLAGEDVPMDMLEIDSLATMELCIAIEANLDVSILPAVIEEVPSLNALVEHVLRLKNA